MPDITERILNAVKTLSSILCFEEAEDNACSLAAQLASAARGLLYLDEQAEAIDPQSKHLHSPSSLSP